MGNIFHILLVISSLQLWANPTVQKVEANSVPKEKLVMDADSFYDPGFDYSKFSGRVTDKDQTGSVVKVASESGNIKFFRAGDEVKFKLASRKDEYCQAFVRSIEEKFFILYVKDTSLCLESGEYFRRGSALSFISPRLQERVREAAIYRASLLKRKKDFFQQLNQVNHDVFNYEEIKLQVAAEFDKRIAEIEKEKNKAIDLLVVKRSENLKLQKELSYRLDTIDQELDFYRIDKNEPMIDRWHLDQDLGLPVQERPQALRESGASNF